MPQNEVNLPTIVGKKVEICKSQMPENALNLHTIVGEILKIESLECPTEFITLKEGCRRRKNSKSLLSYLTKDG